MDHFAGLDVSVKETSICIVEARGHAAASEHQGVSLMGRWAWARGGDCGSTSPRYWMNSPSFGRTQPTIRL
jgi:hypothetical protein